jgi:ABC-type glutathione transport system ATPase component
MNRLLVSVENVSKNYRSAGTVVQAVHDVSLTIEEGESFGLVGESGSGKSTLSRLVLGLERPTAGRVEFAGLDLAHAGGAQLRKVRRDMQVVFQDPVASLNRRQTVRRIISAPLEVHGMGDRAERLRRVNEVLELVQLSPRYGDRYPSQLSGGQCQRVSIARALTLSPRFIVLDEAVSAVDVSVRGQLLNLLRRLQEDLHLAYLFISHDLAVVRYMTERVAVMKEGVIVELAPRGDIFSTPRHEYTRALMAAIPEPPAITPASLDWSRGRNSVNRPEKRQTKWP